MISIYQGFRIYIEKLSTVAKLTHSMYGISSRAAVLEI